MKKNIMITGICLLILVTFLISGCTESGYDRVKDITIHSSKYAHDLIPEEYQTRIINEKCPINLLVNGYNENITVASAKKIVLIELKGGENIIYVSNGIPIEKISIDGYKNTIYIPKESNPEIENIGSNCSVVKND